MTLEESSMVKYNNSRVIVSHRKVICQIASPGNADSGNSLQIASIEVFAKLYCRVEFILWREILADQLVDSTVGPVDLCISWRKSRTYAPYVHHQPQANCQCNRSIGLSAKIGGIRLPTRRFKLLLQVRASFVQVPNPLNDVLYFPVTLGSPFCVTTLIFIVYKELPQAGCHMIKLLLGILLLP